MTMIFQILSGQLKSWSGKKKRKNPHKYLKKNLGFTDKEKILSEKKLRPLDWWSE